MYVVKKKKCNPISLKPGGVHLLERKIQNLKKKAKPKENLCNQIKLLECWSEILKDSRGEPGLPTIKSITKLE